MTIEEKLKLYILEKYCTMAKFSEDVGISPATLSAIFKRGLENCSASNLFKICDKLSISVDALKEGEVIPKIDYMNRKEAEINQAIRLMSYFYYFTLNGKRLSEMEMETIKNNFDLTIEILKKKRKMIEKEKIIDDFHESRDAFFKWQEIDRSHKEDKE